MVSQNFKNLKPLRTKSKQVLFILLWCRRVNFSLDVYIHFLRITASNVAMVRFFVASGFDVVGSCALRLCVTGLICQTHEDTSVQK